MQGGRLGRMAIAFLLGHCCVHVSPCLPANGWITLLIVLLLLCLRLRAWTVCAFVLGVGWAWVHAGARLNADVAPQLEGQDVRVVGTIASIPEGIADPQFTFDIEAATPGLPSRAQLTWYGATDSVWPGERWSFTVRLKRRNGFANPGGFDYEGYLFRSGIGATGYVRSDGEERKLQDAAWRYPITQARAWIAQRMASAVAQSAEASAMLGVLQGLAVGETQHVTADQWRVFAITGTTHLMAISGLHITMLAALAALIGGAIVYYPRAQARGWTVVEGRSLAGFCAACAYSLLAGFSVPTQRTLLMLAVYFWSYSRRRELTPGQALSISVVAVLLIDPFAPLAIGAWLSFGAVTVIWIATQGQLRVRGPVRNFMTVQAALTVGLLPLLISGFGQLSLVSPLANAIAIPAFSLCIVPLTLAGAAFAAVSPPLGTVPLELAASLMQLLWRVLEWLAAQPFASWFPAAPPLTLLIALSIGALGAVLPVVWPVRVAALMLCVPAVLHRPAPPQEGQFHVSVLDVGQGLAVVVRTRSHTLLYDTGPAFRSGRSAAELAIGPFLRARGLRRLDMLMITHGDADHDGGRAWILKSFATRALVFGPSVLGTTDRTSRCGVGQRWIWDGVAFEILHPSSSAVLDDNNSSCVLRVSAGEWSVLLTGDIEAQAEAELLSRGVEPVTAVIAPHHGSGTSSTTAFIAALKPRWVLFATGYRNRWGFPKPEVRRRWLEAGAVAVDTSESGAIELHFSAGTVPQLATYRTTYRRYWHRQ